MMFEFECGLSRACAKRKMSKKNFKVFSFNGHLLRSSHFMNNLTIYEMSWNEDYLITDSRSRLARARVTKFGEFLNKKVFLRFCSVEFFLSRSITSSSRQSPRPRRLH